MNMKTEPLIDFNAHYLHADWEEDYEDLEASVKAFVEDATDGEILALHDAISFVLSELPRGAELPIDLWPFDQSDAPPHEILPSIREALLNAL